MTEYAISPAWRLHDANLEKEAIRFWEAQNILPPGVQPAARAKELCAIAHHGAELAGVATATIEELPFLRSRFAMFRCAVAPGTGARISHSSSPCSRGRCSRSGRSNIRKRPCRGWRW